MNELEVYIIKSLQDFLNLECITDSKNEGLNKLVFPIKRDKTRRLSEQEARFLLVNQLEKKEQTKYQYSIETPTTKTYSFTGKGERSGNIDLCIYENGKRCNLIEFKALNPNQSSYSKDFEKLLCDESDFENFFIQVIENSNNGTISNIEKKYRNAIQSVKVKYLSLSSCLIIFICDVGKKSIIKYEVDEYGNISKNDVF